SGDVRVAGETSFERGDRRSLGIDGLTLDGGPAVAAEHALAGPGDVEVGSAEDLVGVFGEGMVHRVAGDEGGGGDEGRQREAGDDEEGLEAAPGDVAQAEFHHGGVGHAEDADGYDGYPQQAPQHDGDRADWESEEVIHRVCSSETMLPSRMRTMRLQRAPTPGSCVTMTKVRPFSALSCSIRPMMSSAVF